MRTTSLLLAVLAALLNLQCSKGDTTRKPGTQEPPGTPAKTWTESWFEHRELLTRVFYDDDVVIYYDKDVDTSIKWPNKYIGDVWRYVKRTYGGHGKDQRLYAIFHTNKLGGGHPGYYYDMLHGYRNTIDCGDGPWLTPSGISIDMTTHEVFHIVESTSFNTKGSVGNGAQLWGDSKFAEIFQYDVYLGLGLTAEAQRWFNHVNQLADNFPRANTFWFRDWLYPVYRDYGGTEVLVRFFKLLSENFPKDADNRYTRLMNWGEFIHFFSGAAKADLKGLATTAFGWPAGWEQEWQKAKTDFPRITY